MPNENGHVKLNQLHKHRGYPLFPIFRALSRRVHHHSSIALGHLHTIHQPNLSLPRTRPPLNHLNTLGYALLVNFLSISALLRISSFLTLPIRHTSTKPFKDFISRTLIFLLSALRILHASGSNNAVNTITPSYTDTFWHLFPIFYCSAYFSALYNSYSFCVPHPFHILYQLPLPTLGT